jgi:hypothetical protein
MLAHADNGVPVTVELVTRRPEQPVLLVRW